MFTNWTPSFGAPHGSSNPQLAWQSLGPMVPATEGVRHSMTWSSFQLRCRWNGWEKKLEFLGLKKNPIFQIHCIYIYIIYNMVIYIIWLYIYIYNMVIYWYYIYICGYRKWLFPAVSFQIWWKKKHEKEHPISCRGFLKASQWRQVTRVILPYDFGVGYCQQETGRQGIRTNSSQVPTSIYYQFLVMYNIVRVNQLNVKIQWCYKCSLIMLASLPVCML